MSSAMDWSSAYARQADADFGTWKILQQAAGVPECHRMLFLQMACEKLCKAHLIAQGAMPETLQTSHGYIAKPLPLIIKEVLGSQGKDLRRMRPLLCASRRLAAEIEVLSPAIDRNGQRPDNCEYPWEDHGGTVHSPLDRTFHPSNLLTTPCGPTFVKAIGDAIAQLLPS